MAQKKGISKDILIMIIGFAVVLLSALSLLFTSQKGLKWEIVSIVFMIVGVFVSILGYNTEA